ncbi:MAG TPA: sensor histidine kinase N-terminal domain-containing protein [Stellaceae bacterium]|nr:sensor histidine kinase N-terminal domain-containing protein [Stellaceae bacterium]
MQPSLRQRLTYWLLGPLLLLVTAGSFVSYRIALNAANKAYDSALLDPVLAIAIHLRQTGSRLELDLPSIAIEALRIDTEDRVYYAVLGPGGEELIAGTARLPAPPERLGAGEHTFYDATLEGERVRVAARAVPVDRGQTAIVQVAETLIKRDKLVLELLVASAVPQVLIAFAAVALLWLGIGQGLRPLDRLRDEIAARSPKDLRPVSERDKPREVRSLIGALNQLLSRLNAAIASQQRFIANAAHQLRTPLAGLKTHAELARREQSAVELRPLLDMIAGETQRTSHLVNQLLTLARAEPGEAPSGQPVNLHEIVGRDVRDWVQRAVGANIDLGFELEDAWTLGEPLLLRELAANLVDNALAYTQSGGSVTVRTGTRGDESVLEVEDNGPGIPEPEREKVFERFYRIPATRGEGCGLGLSIVSEIAELHSARVDLGQPAGGHGTLIRVLFPRLAAQAPQPPLPVSTRAVPTSR